MGKVIIGNRHYVALFLPNDFNLQGVQECMANNMRAVSRDYSAIIETDELRARLMSQAGIPVVKFHAGLVVNDKVREVYMQQIDYTDGLRYGIAAPMMPTPWSPDGRNAIAGFRSALDPRIRERLFDLPPDMIRDI